MSEAVRIRHCRLRFVRRGGWSWGADPKRLADVAARQLPALVAKLLDEQLANCPPDAVIPRLTLRIPARLDDLYRLPVAADAGAVPDVSSNASLQRLRAAVAASVRQAVPELDARAAPSAVDAKARAQRASAAPTPVVEALCHWQQDRVLSVVLASMEPAVLAAWTDAVLAELETAAQRRSLPWAGLADAAARLMAVRARGDAATALRVAALVRVVEALSSASAVAAEVAVAPAGAAAAAAADSARAQSSLAQLRALAVLRASRRAAAPRPADAVPAARPGRVEVDSVLPFVVLGVLARSGYLAALAGALAAIDALDEAAAFGAAVVYKLAPPSRRGWDRAGPTARLAAAVCGRAAPPGNEPMARFLRSVSTVCAPLDAALWTRSHAARSRSGVLVDRFDAAGQGAGWSATALVTGQPLGWFATPAALMKLVQLLPQQSWWLAPAAADAALVQPLLGAGAKVVSARLPEPEAGWLAVTPGWWSNDAALRRHAARLVAVCDDALQTQREHVQEFIERRPLVLRDGAVPCAAEASITLAVTSALGAIAAELWGARESTTPLLALQRLGDLGGSVLFEDRRVLVRPALGQRFMDLNQHGLLRDIAGVPWLPGQFIAFAGP